MQSKGSTDAEKKRGNAYVFSALYWGWGLLLMVGMGGVWVVLSSSGGHHGLDNTEVVRFGQPSGGAAAGGSALGDAAVMGRCGDAMRDGGAIQRGSAAQGGGAAELRDGGSVKYGARSMVQGSNAVQGKVSSAQRGARAWVKGSSAAQGNVDIYFLTGRNNKSSSGVGFTTVPAGFCSKAMELQPEVIEAFGKMRRAAAGAGIALTIISGRRTFEQQKTIWVNKWNKLQSRGIHGVDAVEHILRYSSMPGSSRHHWGTDIDINSLEPAYFNTAKGAKELAWLRANAHNYGFAEVYSPRTTGRSTGYQPEPWHWSYMPLASSYLTQYKQKIGYNHFGIPDSLYIIVNPKNPEKKSINNIELETTLMIFPGSEFAKRFKIIEDYVLGVSTF